MNEKAIAILGISEIEEEKEDGMKRGCHSRKSFHGEGDPSSLCESSNCGGQDQATRGALAAGGPMPSILKLELACGW